ncbi:MAG: DNA recombination protein RmuC [Planctomycetes bacterium]|nr:DNA recombination protein RmuC [Planctomycetota bacterium]
MEVIILVLATIGCVLGIYAATKLLKVGDTAGQSVKVEEALEKLTRRQETAMRDEFERAREGREKSAAQLRVEMSKRLDSVSEQLKNTLVLQLKGMREEQAKQATQLREGNEKKLDEMRKTVDEKLQGTLEKRLGEAFKQVGERLESVQKGLGEMKQLAVDVGDFKKVLTNVKSRGTWGEVQLRAILEQMLTAGQWETNVKPIPGSNAHVEVAIKLPGTANQEQVWLPIDSKFPQEDFVRLQEAQDRADPDAVEAAAKGLEGSLILAAKEIREKYIAPPHTTEFGILFLPTEGLYAEALRRQKIVDELNRMRITIAGPTTLSAILNALRMGFHTLAIEKRSSEVWEVLGAVKTEFGKFGDVLDKLGKQLKTAQNTISETNTRTRQMERKLKSVEELPDERSQALLDLDPVDNDAAE